MQGQRHAWSSGANVPAHLVAFEEVRAFGLLASQHAADEPRGDTGRPRSRIRVRCRLEAPGAGSESGGREPSELGERFATGEPRRIVVHVLIHGQIVSFIAGNRLRIAADLPASDLFLGMDRAPCCDYPAALANRPGLPRHAFRGPSFPFPPCLPDFTAACSRSHFPRSPSSVRLQSSPPSRLEEGTRRLRRTPPARPPLA